MHPHSAERVHCLTMRSEPDRRSSPRTLTVFLMVRIKGHSDVGLFRVRNLSDTGLNVIDHGHLQFGGVVLIEFATELACAATAVRCDGDSSALEFHEPIDSAKYLKRLAEIKREDRRRAVRLPVYKRAMSYSEAGVHTVRITNVSPRGVCVAHRGSLEQGTVIKLVLESGTMRRGAVCWSKDGYAGVFLDEPFALHDLESASCL